MEVSSLLLCVFKSRLDQKTSIVIKLVSNSGSLSLGPRFESRNSNYTLYTESIDCFPMVDIIFCSRKEKALRKKNHEIWLCSSKTVSGRSTPDVPRRSEKGEGTRLWERTGTNTQLEQNISRKAVIQKYTFDCKTW